MLRRSAPLATILIALMGSAGSIGGCVTTMATARLRLLAVEEAEHPDGALVYIDGHLVGELDELAAGQGPLLSAGKHRLEVRKPGHFPFQTTVDVRGGQNVAEVIVELLEDPR